MITNMPKLFSEFDLAAYKQAMRKVAVKVEHRRDDARVEGQEDIEDVQDVDDEGDLRVCWELAIRLVINGNNQGHLVLDLLLPRATTSADDLRSTWW